jgi:hypothetical protein
MPRYITQKVTKFSFVMPVFDNDTVDKEIYYEVRGCYRDLMIPCEDRHMVAYNVYGWQYVKQTWKLIGVGEYYQEAKEIAEKYDKKMVKRLGIYCEDMGNKREYA